MKNPYTILSQKELEVARVRKEIRALLTVILLLVDGPLSWDELQTQLLSSGPDIEHSVEDGMANMDMQQEHLAIAQRAYELFEMRGCEHGHDWEDWFRAELELNLNEFYKKQLIAP